jgi:hypothetical protein
MWSLVGILAVKSGLVGSNCSPSLSRRRSKSVVSMESWSSHSAVTEIGCGAAKWRVNLTITSTRPAHTTDAAMITVSGDMSQYQRLNGAGDSAPRTVRVLSAKNQRPSGRGEEDRRSVRPRWRQCDCRHWPPSYPTNCCGGSNAERRPSKNLRPRHRSHSSISAITSSGACKSRNVRATQ